MVTFFIVIMGFVEQSIATIRNNRSVRKVRNTFKEQFERWYSTPKRNPAYEDLKKWRTSRKKKRIRIRLLAVIIFIVIALLSVLTLTKFLS